MPSAQEAFNAWFLNLALIGGSLIAAAFFVAFFVVAMSSRKSDRR